MYFQDSYRGKFLVVVVWNKNENFNNDKREREKKKDIYQKINILFWVYIYIVKSIFIFFIMNNLNKVCGYIINKYIYINQLKW